MIIELIECSFQLLCIMIALLFSLFRYISLKKKGWLYSVCFFTGSLLSSYFWTIYLLVMKEDPNTSSFLTYFGWNTAFLILLLMNLHMKDKEDRRYFHPLMLVPIPLNAVQLMIYTKFGGVVMSVYQVGICTVIACLCIQSIMLYLKKRKSGKKVPYVAIVTLLNIAAEFGMWTSTCFEGWVHHLYYPASFISSISYILLLIAISKSYKGEADSGQEMITNSRLQKSIKLAYGTLVLISSLGGYLLCRRIRDLLMRSIVSDDNSDAYSIISTVLFLISLILAALAVTIVLVIYFEHRVSENDRLRREKQLAEQSNAAKSDFLANMSHEIRTPLNAVLGMNKMIILECLKTGEQRSFEDIYSYAENIGSAGNDLLAIINDILDFSKIEAGKLDICENDYMLSSVLNDVSNLILFRARDKGLEFSVEADSTLPDRLSGDDVHLRQIMMNLLTNAVKYTDNGRVTLSVSKGEQEADKVELIISVKDTGIGIKPEELGKIFDKFERTDLKRNSTVEGTGLGLSITDRLVSLLGGSISVESVYGKGSEFTVRLPQRVLSEEQIGDLDIKFKRSMKDHGDSEHYFRAPDACILIVDDTRMNLTVAAGLIKDTEIVTDTAESGSAALRLTLENKYDLILMDQRMPEMDGTETLHRLRAQENRLNAETPVICLTADALSGAKERYKAEGFNDHLSKPIDSRRLKQMLMQYLPQEKVILTDGEQHDTHTADTSGGAYSGLRALGINTSAGLAYCNNDRELYDMMLAEYITGAAERKERLERFFGDHDAKNYAIVVHALKSTSRSVGVDRIAEEAAALEKAADSEQWDILEKGHPALMEEFDMILAKMTEITGVSVTAGGADIADDEIMEFYPE
ncbi:ATP-binding protein [uncultured Ruminococcus sp.]|uniref:ATP-binding protein n=1 Tax=uncultured Ruminococcus sp. TaxID=165186 RepID=UPI0025D29EDE|nr:ATP-binding protein [uncultured Ruminococcus sp.]